MSAGRMWIASGGISGHKNFEVFGYRYLIYLP